MMNRRRLFAACAAVFFVVSLVAALYVLSRPDDDFVVTGPKSQGVRANLDLLDSKIDPANYRECKTFGAVVNQLMSELNRDEVVFFVLIDMGAHEKTAGSVRRDLRKQPVQLPASSEKMSVKQLLRLAKEEADAPHIMFVIHDLGIMVLHQDDAAKARAEYLERLTVFDRVVAFWREATGNLEP